MLKIESLTQGTVLKLPNDKSITLLRRAQDHEGNWYWRIYETEDEYMEHYLLHQAQFVTRIVT